MINAALQKLRRLKIALSIDLKKGSPRFPGMVEHRAVASIGSVGATEPSRQRLTEPRTRSGRA